jgi:hypothetical protein
VALDPAIRKFLLSAGVFFLDGAIGGGLGAIATGNPLSKEGIQVFLVGGLGGGLTSLRHYLKTVEGEVGGQDGK